MPCKHAALALIYAQQMAECDEPWLLWQLRGTSGTWENCWKQPEWREDLEYRQIPQTILINGHEVPEPMREKPEIGTEYFHVSCSSPSGFRAEFWHNLGTYNLIFKRGLCHTTKEAAIAHAKALFSFSEIKD